MSSNDDRPAADPWSGEQPPPGGPRFGVRAPEQGPPTPPPGYPPPPPGYPGAPAYHPYGSPAGPHPMQRRNGIGVAALVVGIVSLLLCWFPVVGFILGVVALVFGIVGTRRTARREADNHGQAIAGLVLGVIAALVGILSTAVVVRAWPDLHTYVNCVSSANTQADQSACEQQFRDNINHRFGG